MPSWDVFHSERLEVLRGLSPEEVRAALAAGSIRDDDLVRPAGSAEPWSRLGDQPGLLGPPPVVEADEDLATRDQDAGTFPPVRLPEEMAGPHPEAPGSPPTASPPGERSVYDLDQFAPDDSDDFDSPSDNPAAQGSTRTDHDALARARTSKTAHTSNSTRSSRTTTNRADEAPDTLEGRGSESLRALLDDDDRDDLGPTPATASAHR